MCRYYELHFHVFERHPRFDAIIAATSDVLGIWQGLTSVSSPKFHHFCALIEPSRFVTRSCELDADMAVGYDGAQVFEPVFWAGINAASVIVHHFNLFIGWPGLLLR